MRVVTVKPSSSGPTGTVVTHSSAFRLVFPVKGCVGRPDDAEAVAEVEREIETTSGATRQRLLNQLASAGVYPVTLAPPVVVEPAPQIVVKAIDVPSVTEEPIVEQKVLETLHAVPEVPQAVEKNLQSKRNRGR